MGGNGRRRGTLSTRLDCLLGRFPLIYLMPQLRSGGVIVAIGELHLITAGVQSSAQHSVLQIICLSCQHNIDLDVETADIIDSVH